MAAWAAALRLAHTTVGTSPWKVEQRVIGTSKEGPLIFGIQQIELRQTPQLISVHHSSPFFSASALCLEVCGQSRWIQIRQHSEMLDTIVRQPGD